MTRYQKIGFLLAFLILALTLSGWLFAKDSVNADPDNDLAGLVRQVEDLNIQRNGYVLGGCLTPEQAGIAESHLLNATLKGTFRFQDQDLVVVAQEKTNRVLVIYHQVENASPEKVRDLIGDLMMQFDDPTVMAHDKVVYWAYGKKGKIASAEFDEAKKTKKKIEILATIKFNSEIHIMEDGSGSDTGEAYYIISSDPILKRLKDRAS